MKSLAPPDSHFASAAIGWLELGNPQEALAEFQLMSVASRANPDVLEIEHAIHVHAMNWGAALVAAEQLLAVAPERASGWLHRAYALRRVHGGGLSAAWNALLPAAEKFPADATILFNLACYACQLGQLDAARAWLMRAMEAGDKNVIRAMALADQDLKPLWAEISPSG